MSNNQFRLVICGADGAGKSTLAKVIADLMESPIYSFGEGVRDYCIENNFLTFQEAYTKPTPHHVRLVLRATGETVRKFNQDYWVNLLERKVVYLPFVVDDCRRTNEIQWAHKKNAYTVFLDCPFNPEIPSFEDLEEVRSLCHLVIRSKSDPPEKLADRVLGEMGLQ